jgi:fumarylacetoacetate (FAA) hydrolase
MVSAMRICRYLADGGTARVGYLDGELIVPVAGGDGQAGLDAVLELAMAANADPGLRPRPDGDPVPLASARLLAPVAEPPSIRDFYAFEQHVRTARARRGLEMHPDWYELPAFYFTNPAAVIGPGDPVAAPPRSAELDYELEVACVLGRDGANLRLDDADRMVAGGLREVPSAVMTATVNGVEWSRADLDGLWWSFAEMLAYASESAPVRRGDVLGSGTCGTGCILELSLVHGSEKYPYLQPGDEVELEVTGLGVLANRVVAGDAPAFRPDPDRVRPRLGQ